MLLLSRILNLRFFVNSCFCYILELTTKKSVLEIIILDFSFLRFLHCPFNDISTYTVAIYHGTYSYYTWRGFYCESICCSAGRHDANADNREERKAGNRKLEINFRCRRAPPRHPDKILKNFKNIIMISYSYKFSI